MKFVAVSTILASAAATASAAIPSASLLQSARRLNENQNQEYAFLADYNLKLITCVTGEPFVKAENGETEMSSIVFRLCPTSGECADEGNKGCSAGHGDFVVGINSFVKEYLESKRDEMQGDDDNFKVNEFGECRQYKADGDAKNGDGEQALYYMGPACTADGRGVRMMLFSDAACSVPSEDTFEEISNGLALPYSDGGLVSDYCESCYAVNDKGEYEMARVCTNLYSNAGKCETNMGTYHYAGQQVDACEYISSIMPRSSKGGAGKIVGWMFFVAFVIGGGYVAYTMYNKRGGEKTHTLMNA